MASIAQRGTWVTADVMRPLRSASARQVRAANFNQREAVIKLLQHIQQRALRRELQQPHRRIRRGLQDKLSPAFVYRERVVCFLHGLFMVPSVVFRIAYFSASTAEMKALSGMSDASTMLQ